MSEFVMPSLGADMEAGTLVEWLVEPGGTVKRGDIIAVVETQKGAIEIEVFEDGVFEKSLAEIGATVAVGKPIAMIRTLAEDGPRKQPELTAEVAVRPPDEEKTEQPAPRSEVEKTVIPPKPAPVRESAARIKVTPAARRLAASNEDLDLSAIKGSGPSGEITIADVEAATGKARPGPEAKLPEPAEAGAGIGMSGMRAAIAAAMSHSKRDIPHYYLLHKIDLSAAETWLENHNADCQPENRLLMGVLFVKAVANAARKFPEFNGHFANDIYMPGQSVHAGIAINIRGGGLVAPAIHRADSMDLALLMSAMRDLVTRVRKGRFRASELSDPTITISSLGERGVEALFGVIYPPQVAIVGFGMPVMRAWASGRMVGARRVVTVTLAGDHRVSDGHRGALFLSEIEHQLENPEAL